MTTPKTNTSLSHRVIHDHCSKGFTEPFNNPRYLSSGNLPSLLSSERIAATLRAKLPDCSSDQIDKYVKYVRKGAKQVFLTLVFSGYVPKISILFKEDFRDENLPIFRDEELNVYTIDDTQRDPWKSFSEDVDGEDVTPFSDAFQTKQWVFLVPSFSSDRFAYNFHALQPLPFIPDKPQIEAARMAQAQPAEGNFGTVCKMRIPVEHFQNLNSGGTANSSFFVVAVKSLKNEGQASQRAEFYDRERSTLEKMKNLKHRHLIRAYAAYERGDDRGFVFPWADKGSLYQLWQRGNTALEKALLAWTISQVKGLVGGIKKLHDNRTRHGDLKPENILVFSSNSDVRGDLVIADVGLAKFHALYTRERYDPTRTRHGSRRYEPPEARLKETKFSRKYDMWSLGCILLELVIWVAQGLPGLQRFFNDSGDNDQFWELYPNLRLRPVIVTHMRQLSRFLQKRPSEGFALARILKLVKEQLLIVDVERRAYSKELWPEIQNIDGISPLESSDDLDNNLQELTPGQPVMTSAGKENYLPLSKTDRHNINDVWQVVTSNTLARSIADQLGWHCPNANTTSDSVCQDCQKLEFSRSEIELGRNTEAIKGGSDACTVCKLLNHCLSNAHIESTEPLRLYRRDFSLRSTPMGRPLISMYCDPGSNDDTTSYAQIALMQLPKATGPERYELVRELLRICDENHPCCRTEHEPILSSIMPRRVVDVGTDIGSFPRLIETSDHMRSRYVALSYCWGQAQDQENHCTTSQNINRFRERLDLDQLPKTLQDAVSITRSLGLRYLWIDSLCIIQDDREDWADEAKKMGDYYSSAYVTIAASSAASNSEGMLYDRPDRVCATVQTSSGHIHLAEALDNFQADVENSILNTRAWVLQERALSRRTIHFTSTQFYWECGQGVHCETLAQLHNPRSQCLGDHDFPSMGLSYYKNERIDFIQYLHTLYGGLGLTKARDRPIAIAGLHNRIARKFDGRFDYGIFWEYFERLILWRAQSPGSLSAIPYDRDAPVPSWSWLAYMGKIGYLDVPYAKVQWLGDIQSPFGAQSADGPFNGCLTASARHLRIGKADLSKRVGLDMDVWADFDGDQWMCITIGKMKADETLKEVPHYVLIVRPSKREESISSHERIGVGILTTSHFSADVKSIRFV